MGLQQARARLRPEHCVGVCRLARAVLGFEHLIRVCPCRHCFAHGAFRGAGSASVRQRFRVDAGAAAGALPDVAEAGAGEGAGQAAMLSRRGTSAERRPLACRPSINQKRRASRAPGGLPCWLAAWCTTQCLMQCPWPLALNPDFGHCMPPACPLHAPCMTPLHDPFGQCLMQCPWPLAPPLHASVSCRRGGVGRRGAAGSHRAAG